ncbi:outer membrane beta-barrel protein [Polynucleobacter sp. MWH-Creno-3A4]|uniref:outer membrane protein n=1 Tax=Polynucleobacter sp. MWH-Creno-3A4 TaxID=1855886 RepID=UPI001C0C5D4C|nr:outer membrane beta-barrel protein [Polynucleobacter sp. MWH-Creno-3A4]MBU3605328.1 outer membrane beta-barrel protein [Polynucleobacter sp. MWH-Creno-3A4]
MKKYLLCFASLVVSSSVLAQNSFTGLDLGVGFALQAVNTGSGTQQHNDGSVPEQFGSTQKTSANANFNVGYNFPVSQSFILGLQAALQPITSGGIQVQKNPGTPTDFQNKSRYDFSVLPGFLIDPDNMIYGKVGYSYTKENVNNADGSWATTLNYSGYVLGLGVKSFAVGNLVGLKNLYGFAEYNYAGYGAKSYSVVNSNGRSTYSSNISLNSSTGLLGIGYIF